MHLRTGSSCDWTGGDGGAVEDSVVAVSGGGDAVVSGGVGIGDGTGEGAGEDLEGFERLPLTRLTLI